MPLKTRGFAHRIDVEARPERVWLTLIGASTLPLWLGSDARIRPQQGGAWSATVAPGVQREAMIDVFDPPRRLRLIYLPPAGLDAYDGAVVDDILLEGERDSTIVRLLCSGIPDLPEWSGHYRVVRASTERTMARLKVLVEQRERMAAAARTTS